MSADTTLRGLLTKEKPRVFSDPTPSKNTANKRWPKLASPSIRIWDDFTLENLNASYGHILDLSITRNDLVIPPRTSSLLGIAINRDQDVNHLIDWNDGLMQPTLKFAKSKLDISPGIQLQHSHSSPDGTVRVRVPGHSGLLMVDHVISVDETFSQNLVVGFGRQSSKWSGRGLINNLDSPTKEICWPLRQLAKMCNAANTRYGYIQTGDELVVCCFSNDAGTWKVAIKPIPWSQSGSDNLTTDLALWWMCMLAMSAHENRAIREESQMVGINKWELVYLDEARGWVEKHRYSKFERPAEFGAANNWFDLNDPMLNNINFNAEALP